MASVNHITGDDASNTLQGTSDADLIYGFDPSGSTSSVSSISAARVATGLSQPVAAPGDSSHRSSWSAPARSRCSTSAPARPLSFSMYPRRLRRKGKEAC